MNDDFETNGQISLCLPGNRCPLGGSGRRGAGPIPPSSAPVAGLNAGRFRAAATGTTITAGLVQLGREPAELLPCQQPRVRPGTAGIQPAPRRRLIGCDGARHRTGHRNEVTPGDCQGCRRRVEHSGQHLDQHGRQSPGAVGATIAELLGAAVPEKNGDGVTGLSGDPHCLGADEDAAGPGPPSRIRRSLSD